MNNVEDANCRELHQIEVTFMVTPSVKITAVNFPLTVFR